MLQSTNPQAITRTSLHHELVSRLQTLIINAELEPGSKVPEKLLCDQFGVSRTPLREALKVLASDGLDAYFSVNQQIHRAILVAAGNSTLTSSCEALSLRMQRARYLANMTQGRWREAVQEHENILAFLVARDGPNLAQTLMGHMNSKRLSVVRWLKTEGTMKD